jgi:hypothetical protein
VSRGDVPRGFVVNTPKGHFKNHEKFFEKLFKNPLTNHSKCGII